MATAAQFYAQNAWDVLSRTGGFSFGAIDEDPFGEAAPIAPTAGYMVGGIIPEVVVPLDRELVEAATSYMARKRERDGYAAHRYYIGAWVNPETGWVHFDLSVNVPTIAEALTRAKITGELAVWDVVNEHEITVT